MSKKLCLTFKNILLYPMLFDPVPVNSTKRFSRKPQNFVIATFGIKYENIS